MTNVISYRKKSFTAKADKLWIVRHKVDLIKLFWHKFTHAFSKLDRLNIVNNNYEKI